VIDLKRKQSKLDMNNPKIKTHLRGNKYNIEIRKKNVVFCSEKNDGNNEGIIDPDVEKPNFDVEHNDVNEDRNQKPGLFRVEMRVRIICFYYRHIEKFVWQGGKISQ
jgi:hypothetical protein